MSRPKTERNEEIISKRNQDPKKWTWTRLGNLYNMHRTRPQKIYRAYMKLDKKVIPKRNVDSSVA